MVDQMKRRSVRLAGQEVHSGWQSGCGAASFLSSLIHTLSVGDP